MEPLEAGAWILAAAMEKELIDHQVSTGHNVAHATRPLTPEEEAVGTRFGDLDAATDKAVTDATPATDLLYDLTIAAVLAEAFSTENDEEETGVEELLLLLLLLLSRPPAAVTDAQDIAAARMEDIITDTYTLGVTSIYNEATHQGADPGKPPALTPGPLILGLAAVIAAHPWRRTIERAITEYSTPARQLEGTTTRGQVKDFITDTSRAGTADQINQAANIAIGQGRIDASDELDPLVDYYLASEVMDGNSCNPCRAVDGTRFPTLEEARKLYGRGYYEQCQGGARCRGKVLAVFPAQG